MPTTRYYLHDATGRRVTDTMDPDTAEEHSRAGLKVTAVTEGA